MASVRLWFVAFLLSALWPLTEEFNPLIEQNLVMLKQKMAETGPDLGACFDGDADRAIFLDENGKMLGSDLITALLARDFFGDRQPQNKHVVPKRVHGGIIALASRWRHNEYISPNC